MSDGTIIRARCRQCGDVELGVADITLTLNDDDTYPGVYHFVCTVCGQKNERPANVQVVSILMATGVVVVGGLRPLTQEVVDLLADNFNLKSDEQIWKELDRLTE